MTLVEKSIHAMKSRVWEGIVPVSHNRWRALNLDDPKHYPTACEYLGAVIRTFHYLNIPENLANLRETFNLISGHLAEFEAALHGRRSMMGNESSIVSMTALWEEYIRVHYQVMATRAHTWVLDHVNALRRPILNDLLAHEPPSEYDLSPEQWAMTNKLHDLIELAARADFTILMPMDGYQGYTAPPPGDLPGLKSPDLKTRTEAYSGRLKMLSRVKTFGNWSRYTDDEKGKGVATPASLVARYREQTDAQDELRIEMRGVPEPLPREKWISRIIRLREWAAQRGESPGPVGFMAYRLSYGQSSEEWALFLQKLEADLADWGDGVAGSADIRELLKLQWLDGKELGIDEGDIDAAKRYVILLASLLCTR
jgi:hypothetical protein